jgi:hypothetical protein
MMANQNSIPIVKYCRHHDMVWNPKSRTWKVVPADFIAELRQAGFPVDLVEQPCRRCLKRIEGLARAEDPVLPGATALRKGGVEGTA